MKRATVIVSVASIAVILCLVACQKADQVVEQPTLTSSDPLEFLQSVFESKYLYVTSISEERAVQIRESTGNVYQDKEEFESSMVEFDQIRAIRSKSSMKYETADVRVDLISKETEGLRSIVTVRVDFALLTNDKDEDTHEPVVVEGFDVYQVEIERNGTALRVISEQLIDLTEADHLIIEFLNNNPEQILEFRSYDDGDAVAWAFNHWNSPPTEDYHDYSNPDGDCTNFLSHCLLHGGWVEVGYWHWHYDGVPSCNTWSCPRSPAWTGANPMYNYLTGSGSGRVDLEFSAFTLPSSNWTNSQLNTVDELKKGDIAQLRWDGVYKHSMLLTKKALIGPMTYFTYRNSIGNSPRKNRPVDEFLGNTRKIVGFHVEA